MFNGYLQVYMEIPFTMPAFLATTIVSLVLGFVISYVYKKVTKEEGTMGMTLICLPFLVQLVIFLVNEILARE